MNACPNAHAVDLHFALRIKPAQEKALRAHLPGCEECRDRYQRHLLLSKLDPRAPRVEERLAAGLGISRRRARPWMHWAVAISAAAVILLMLSPAATEVGFIARGGAGSVPPQVVVFAVSGGAAAPVGRRITRNDELAFAYRNPDGRRFLLIFAVDEHGHVYWYHPAWPENAAEPRAVAVQQGTEFVELREAIVHAFDGKRLTVHSLLLDQPLGVRDIEARLAARRSPLVEGAHHETLELEVGP
jgi:hypothetical protein